MLISRAENEGPDATLERRTISGLRAIKVQRLGVIVRLAEMMGADAGLHADQTRRLIRQSCFDLATQYPAVLRIVSMAPDQSLESGVTSATPR